jgi:opacity protein-like surface antigen
MSAAHHFSARRGRTCHLRVAAGLVALALGAYAGAARAEPSDLPPEIGYNYAEIETPRIAAMGGAQRAFSNSLEGLFVNPANMAASRIYHLGAFAQIWPEASRQSYGAAAVDSIVSSTRVAGGIGGTWNLQDPDGIERQWVDIRFALAFPFSDQFFFGVGGRHLRLSQDGDDGEIGSSAASGGLADDQILRAWAFDAGMTLKPSSEFAISIVGNNLNNPGTGFQPASVGGGIGYGNENLTLEVDVLSDFTTWDETTARVMAGVEFLAGDHYPLRVGYRYDQGAGSHAVSGGVGYIDRAFAAELAVRRVVSPSDDAATVIVLGFKYHLESTGLEPSAVDTF